MSIDGERNYSVSLLRCVDHQEQTEKQFQLSNESFTIFTAKALKHFARLNTLETVSEGWQLWIFVDELRKQIASIHSMRTEVAYWFKLDAFSLSDCQVLALRDSLHKLQCQERIHRGDYDPMDHKGIYHLFLHAFGDEELARKQQTNAFKLFVEKATKSK